MKNNKLEASESNEVPSKVEPNEDTNALPADVCEILQQLKPEQRSIIAQSLVAMRSESFSGPLPHPEILKGYDNVLPGAAERVLKMAEKEQDHRFDCDNKLIGGQLAQSKRGQWMGFTIVLILIAVAIMFFVMGDIILAGTILSVTIGSIATIFYLGKKPTRSEHPTES